MTTTIEEINVRCPECERNIFEAVDNGRCVYCGAVVVDSGKNLCTNWECQHCYVDVCEHPTDNFPSQCPIRQNPNEDEDDIIEGVL